MPKEDKKEKEIIPVLTDLACHWENIVRRKWIDSETEDDPIGKRLIEHGALCYQNCARELREAIISVLPEPSTIQGEGQK
jgi:hypothetical protein